MARGADSRRIDKSFSRKRLDAAHAFLRQARQTAASADDADNPWDRSAAVSSAVLAGIAAADVACVLRLGEVWKGDHSQAPMLLRKIGKDGKDAANSL